MYCDICCICEEFIDEDCCWFLDIVGSDWLVMLKFVMKSFKDESFILQFFLFKVICDLKLFSIFDDDQKDDLLVVVIYDEVGYCIICEILVVQYNFGNCELNIQIWNVDCCGDCLLILCYQQFDCQLLSDFIVDVFKYLYCLWGFDIYLEILQGDQFVQIYYMLFKGVSEGEEGYLCLDLIILFI